MFPAWSRAHACYAPVAPAWSPTLWTITNEHVPIGPVSNRRSRAPQSAVLPILQFHIQVSEWRAWQADGACLIDVPTLAEVSTQPCKMEKTPCLGYCMYKVHVHVHGTKICRARARGPIRSLTHTGARRFSAPYSKSHRGRGQSTLHRPRLPSLMPPSVPVYLGGMFPRWYHTHGTSMGKTFWLHKTRFTILRYSGGRLLHNYWVRGRRAIQTLPP